MTRTDSAAGAERSVGENRTGRTAGAVLSVHRADDPVGLELWTEAWRRTGEGDIFAHPDYVRAVALEGEHPTCAVMSFADGTEIYYPFIVRPISSDAAGNALDEELWDLYTPLVYGGPMGRCASASEIDEFWTAMRAWAQEHRIVSEIIRFTPVRRNRLPYPGTLREQAPHIVVDLGLLSEDDIIARLHKSVRRRYRKARDAGLTIRMVPDESGIDDFVLLHTETMIRAGAHQKFHVDADFLRLIHRAVPGQALYVFACEDGVPQSAEMMVFRDGSSYAYLAGTLTAALSGNSTTYAAVAAMLAARERGSNEHVLAGGVTNTVDDKLLHFKRGFTRDGDRTYYTGEQVFLVEDYERLCAPAGVSQEQTGFFPAYRARSRAEDGHAVPGEQAESASVGEDVLR
ncbi:hypothetical protein [Brachybacterium tyrofermentans]|uniref:hypothetical protein n=1 Tax=Brachybacterium tyrofermentans TaxID=47848 RepID=UPI003F9036E0